jgi:hypothetical protein
MKLSHKLITVSAAALIGVSPILSMSQAALVQAANKPAKAKKNSAKKTASQKGTIKLSSNAYVYDKNGKRLKTYMGSAKNTVIAKGYTVKYNSKKTINNKEYYDLGGGAFIKAANVGYVDGKKVDNKKTTTKPAPAATTAKLKSNSYIYDAKGKTAKKKLKKGQVVNVDQLLYIGSKLYYRISGQTNQFIKAVNVASTTGAKLKPSNKKPSKNDKDQTPSDNQNDATIITLSKNAYLYDGKGNSGDKLIKKGQKIQVDKLQYIDGKLYYHVNDAKYPGDDQWIKKNNVGIITGKQLLPTNESKPDDTQTGTIATLGNDANVYNNKGVLQSTKTFAKGHTARVTELRYIWVESENKAELFYKLQSDKNGYLKASDVSGVSGDKLIPVNTEESAKDETVMATVTDKKPLQDALTDATSVKNSDAYKLSAKTLRDEYDNAVASGTQVNNASSTIASVKNEINKITKAKAALNGKKVVVNDLKNLTMDEANQIVQVVATANGVAASTVQFSNNNTVLTIVGSNGFQQTLNIADYATTNK